MNYLTPALFTGLQEYGDEQGFLAANQAWEGALEAYRSHLANLLPDLPAGARRFVEWGSCHDARVLSMAHGRGRLTVVLQPEQAPARLVVLDYRLAAPPSINLAALPDRYRSPQATWLYDELGIERAIGFDGDARAPVFTHDVLLSNGCEVRVRFHQMKLARPHAILPAYPATPTVPFSGAGGLATSP